MSQIAKIKLHCVVSALYNLFMFSGKIIAFFFIISFILLHIRSYFYEKGKHGFGKPVLIFEIITYSYLIICGLYLLSGWVDPFASADPSQLGRAAAKSGGKGGIVILIIKFWPYILIGWGSYALFQTWKGGWFEYLRK